MRTLFLLCLLAAPAADAATCTASSGVTHNRLLELYTSEGCSSCPPADRWLSLLPRDSGVVPLAFHVDYWDRLGWKDPYGQAAFSQRQQARNTGLGWAYTPQVMLDGEDFRGWQRGLPTPAAAPARLALALTINVTPEHVEVSVTPRWLAAEADKSAQLYLALTENRLESRVSAGENAHRTLHHDHVVREWVGPLPVAELRHRFLLAPNWKRADLGVTAYAQDGKGVTLQVIAGACL